MDTTEIANSHKLVATSTKTSFIGTSTNGKFYRNYKNFNSDRFDKELEDALILSSYRVFQKRAHYGKNSKVVDVVNIVEL